MAFIANSLPIKGSAMLIEELIKVQRKKAKVIASKADLLFTALFMFHRQLRDSLYLIEDLGNQDVIDRSKISGSIGDLLDILQIYHCFTREKASPVRAGG